MADYLARALDDDRVDRAPRWGAKDQGDISGVRVWLQKVAIECKNTARINLGVWASEAEVARGNSDALAGVVVHKRHGKGQPEEQWVTMTLQDFAALLTGERPEEKE